jgi:phage gpG-like protein
MPERLSFDVIITPLPAMTAELFFGLKERVQKLEEPMKQVIEAYSEEIQENFDVEGRPEKWEDLASSTIATRVRQGYGPGPILERSGALKDEATDPGSWDITIEGQTVVGLQAVPGYGAFHITGAPGSNMPERDWSYMSPQFLDYADEIYDEYLYGPEQ